MTSSSRSYDDMSSSDAGSPLPSFDASSIDLTTVAPALGVPSSYEAQPDYLDYNNEAKGRGIVVTMFSNAGLSYLTGVVGGGLYGLREGLLHTPSSRFKVKLNSVLNHCGRHGSRVGNALGTLSVIYSLYEGIADQVRIIRSPRNRCDVSPPLNPASNARTRLGFLLAPFKSGTYLIYTSLSHPSHPPPPPFTLTLPRMTTNLLTKSIREKQNKTNKKNK